MADIEKVINGLEQTKRDIAEVFVSGSQIAVDTLRINKAIELLKEQEAVEPKTDDAWPSRIKTCGACGTCLFAVGDYKPKYCSECGRRVKWNE